MHYLMVPYCHSICATTRDAFETLLTLSSDGLRRGLGMGDRVSQVKLKLNYECTFSTVYLFVMYANLSLIEHLLKTQCEGRNNETLTQTSNRDLKSDSTLKKGGSAAEEKDAMTPLSQVDQW